MLGVRQKLLKQTDSELQLLFPSVLDLDGFETILEHAYSATRKYQNNLVHFNLSFVSWIDAMQLSMLSLWILELLESGKAIKITLPEQNLQRSTLEFLSSTKFIAFLKEHHVKINNEFIPASKRFPYKNILYPLTFASSDSFQDILSKLDMDDYYQVIFDEVRHAAVTKKGIIKDIVLREIGENMYNHAAGKFANFCLIKHHRSHHIPRRNKFEKNFFDMLGDSDYIELIICDKGNGIKTTLSKSYKLEHGIKQIDTCDIVDYATREYSTSRTRVQRLKQLVEKLSADLQNIQVFTGLYQVKETVLRYHGLLLIRSGNAYVAYYNNQNGKPQTIKSAELNGYKKLSNFGGTQIRILLPVFDEKRFQIKDRIPFDLREVRGSIEYEVICLSNFFNASKSHSIDEQLADSYERLIDQANKLCRTTEKPGIIIDFALHSKIDSKVLFLIVWQIMAFQKTYFEKVFVITNLNSNILEVLDDAIVTKSDYIKVPIVVFDTNYKRHFIGFNLDDKKLFNEILESGTFITDEHTDIWRRFKHLFRITESDLSANLQHARSEILSNLLNHHKNAIRNIIYDPTKQFHLKNLKVLTFPGKYSCEYFQLYDLVNSKQYFPELVELVRISLKLYKIKRIISVGAHNSTLITNVLKTDALLQTQQEHFATSVYNHEADFIHFSSDLTDLNTLVFTDVIGSGRTTERIVSNLGGKSNLFCLCLVNLSGKANFYRGDEPIPVISCIEREFNHLDNKPYEWDYNDIYTVDRSTNKLVEPASYIDDVGEFEISEELKSLGIVKQKEKIDGEAIYINGILEEVVIPSKAYLTRACTKQLVLPIMFNVSLIIETIAEAIAEDFVQTITQYKKHEGVETISIVYLEYDGQPFKRVLKEILHRVPGVELNSIPQNYLSLVQKRDNYYKGKAVFIIDDVLTTGETLTKLIDYCEAKGATNVISYILIKACTGLAFRRIGLMKKYGNASVSMKCLFDVQFPSYKVNSSEISSTKVALDRLLSQFHYEKPIEKIIKTIETSHLYNSFESIASIQSTRQEPDFLIVRWELEMAKTRLQFRKQLSRYFEAIEVYNSRIRVFFEILESEYFVFLKDDAIRESIFYPVFKSKIVTYCKRYIIDSKDDTDIKSLFNIVTSLYYFDQDLFVNFFHGMDGDLVSRNQLMHVLLVQLSIHCCTIQQDPIRRHIVNKIMLPNASRKEEAVLNKFLKLWTAENNFLPELSKQKIHQVKLILKSNFHDLQKLLANLLLFLDFQDIPNAKLFWERITIICNSAISSYESFFYGDFYHEIYKKVFPLIKQLNDKLLIVDKLFDDSDIDTQTVSLFITEIHSLIFANEIGNREGLYALIENHLRIDLKPRVRKIIEDFTKANLTVTRYITDDPCNVFCTEIDLSIVLSNVFNNIIEHSKAKNIYVSIEKEYTDKGPIIILEISDDGPESDKFRTYGVGLTNCEACMELYSGSFLLTHEPFTKNGRLFFSGVKILLYDLSKDVLNLPKNG